MKIAICPGSFDPITNGHVDIICRAAKMFDKVKVLVLMNPKKNYTFSMEQRKEMVIKSICFLPNVTVDAYNGLLADYAESVGADTIVKGLRAMSDFEYEFQMALANRKLNPKLETVFLASSPENTYLSSSMVKQIAGFGGDVSGFIPKEIYDDVNKVFLK